MFFLEHSVDEIEDKLSLAAGGIGNAGTMQVGLAADEKLETYQVSLDLDSHMEGTALRVFFLCGGEVVVGQ